MQREFEAGPYTIPPGRSTADYRPVRSRSGPESTPGTEPAPGPVDRIEVELVTALPDAWASGPDRLWREGTDGASDRSIEGVGADDGDAPGATRSPRQLLLLDGRRLDGGGEEPAGAPAEGAVIPLLRAGGLPAAAATVTGGVCRIALAIGADAPILAGPELSPLLESLAREGCGLGPRLPAAEVDRALAVLLEREDLPVTVARAELRALPTGGVDFTPWLLVLVLLLAGVEWLRTRRLDRGRRFEGTLTPPSDTNPGPTP